MKPQPFSQLLRVLDYLMVPLMWVVSCAPFERPQESHLWHAQRLNLEAIDNIDVKSSITLRGNDTSKIINGSGLSFHVPLIGGWRNYIVLEVQPDISKWHIGWVVRNFTTGEIVRSELHKLPLTKKRVRMLIGTPTRITMFFAVDTDGNQLPLKVTGRGSMGDGSKYRHIRLF